MTVIVGRSGSLLVVCLACFVLMEAGQNAKGQERRVNLMIEYNAGIPANVKVSAAILKYGKDFAYSFTFDDGNKDAFTNGFRLFSGGYSPVDGITYAGLRYTDGCGNSIPFRAGIAWITANSVNKDLHVDTPGNLTYTDAIDLDRMGWEFYNHSYNHKAWSDSIRYSWQLSANDSAFNSRTGLNLRFCIPPSGDTNYLKPAFLLGTEACFSSSLSVTSGSMYDLTRPVMVGQPVFYRKQLSSDGVTIAEIKADTDLRIANSNKLKPLWINDFTHRVSNEQISSSLEFEIFKSYFEYLEKKYGAGGLDNGLFAPCGEVFDYLLVRDLIKISHQVQGSTLRIILDYSRVPVNLRYYDITLIINSPGTIVRAYADVAGTVTHAAGNGGQLVNLKLTSQALSSENQSLPESEDLKIYPNPSDGICMIKLPAAAGKVTVLATNSAGMLMPPVQILRQEGILILAMPSEDYPSGTYLLSLISTDGLIGHCRLILKK